MLFYASQVVEGESLESNFDADSFRKRLNVEILGNCNLNGDFNICHVCREQEAPEQEFGVRTRQVDTQRACEKCSHFTHLMCSMVPPRIAKRPDYVFVCQEIENYS